LKEKQLAGPAQVRNGELKENKKAPNHNTQGVNVEKRGSRFPRSRALTQKKTKPTRK